jgi:hypothetical protein
MSTISLLFNIDCTDNKIWEKIERCCDNIMTSSLENIPYIKHNTKYKYYNAICFGQTCNQVILNELEHNFFSNIICFDPILYGDDMKSFYNLQNIKCKLTIISTNGTNRESLTNINHNIKVCNIRKKYLKTTYLKNLISLETAV